MPSMNKVILLHLAALSVLLPRLPPLVLGAEGGDEAGQAEHVSSVLLVTSDPWPDYPGLTVDCPRFIATAPSAVSSSHH